ncbi:pro-neuregulin-1, membrane-bound isoform isoform X6 [Seriola aureovittata]|uniref:pro-neuregulin-1, membrane-bound isoform isoform X6 n=1 Tax=Seriola aureovittata TaxID=2871759 RepID=UPI0024BDB96D|nr:pro-neuregulin-1, membrane-bound isoform isoform X6 [Seriola aureovittata]
MTEGMEDLSAGPVPPPGSASPTGSTVDTGQVPEEKPEETEAAGESGEEGAEGTAEGGGDGDGEHLGALGIVALPGSCCVCIEVEQINNCLHSEKICILPILACLLSLALCTAGLKWVFVDKIFEYEPPTHLDPKPIGQDPIIISIDPTLGLTVSIPHSSPSTVSLTTAIAITPGRPEVVVEEKSTRGPYVPQTPRVTQSDSSFTLQYNAERPTISKQTPHPQSTEESNDIIIPTISATSTTSTAKTSSHVTRCSDSQKNYCVNGGECFTLEIMPGSTKFLCRKQRKKLHDRLRQSLRNKRNHSTKTGTGPNLASSARGRQISNLPLQDLQLINQCNGISLQHAAEKETETTFSTSKYALSAHEATTLTHVSSQRFVSAMTTPTQLSPVSQTSPATPGSPPSEMSAPLSSLAISVPSVALSPSGEEERPLLLSNRRQPNKSSNRDDQKRTSAHYNYGHVAHSLPPSPLFTTKDVNYTGNHDDTAASHEFSASPEQVIHTNNNVSDCSTKKRAAVPNGHVLRHEEPLLTTDSTAALTLRALDSSRTNPAAPHHDMRVRSFSSTQQHPVAV